MLIKNTKCLARRLIMQKGWLSVQKCCSLTVLYVIETDATDCQADFTSSPYARQSLSIKKRILAA